MMTDRRYYLDEYSDEVVPCDCTLAGWAEWLSKPSDEWNHDEPANDGDTFTAAVIRFEDDVIATKGPSGWSFDREPPADLLAVRFGKGMGWSPDNICDDWDAVREFLSEDDGDSDGPEYIAIGINEPDVVVTYHNTGAPSCTVTTRQ